MTATQSQSATLNFIFVKIYIKKLTYVVYFYKVIFAIHVVFTFSI